ncbi:MULTISPECIES: response regulator [unclassified Pseudomonas]|jgi:DNA-binding NtrC family response regulator|uniref:response regulator n=1 Tax=unclassified Pseudomonas TaxID=196821 RepID=UPI00069E9F6E|nr:MULTISPECIES: response regulator [unclassified Pseudomonas]WPN44541.1 response regulator [Pseudomonas sp. P8_241]
MPYNNILTADELVAINTVFQEAALEPQKILIVEDDPCTREMLTEILQVNGLLCLQARSAVEAMRALSNDNSVELIITDLRMYPHDGLQLIRMIRESEWADLPILIISGDAGVRDAIEAMRLNVVDFLLKPINPDELISLVHLELGFRPENLP